MHYCEFVIILFLSPDWPIFCHMIICLGPTLEKFDFTIRIGSTPTLSDLQILRQGSQTLQYTCKVLTKCTKCNNSLNKMYFGINMSLTATMTALKSTLCNSVWLRAVRLISNSAILCYHSENLCYSSLFSILFVYDINLAVRIKRMRTRRKTHKTKKDITYNILYMKKCPNSDPLKAG